MPLRRAGTVPNTGACYGPGSAAHRHSASKTRVNALMAKSYALRCVRGTAYPFRTIRGLHFSARQGRNWRVMLSTPPASFRAHYEALVASGAIEADAAQ